MTLREAYALLGGDLNEALARLKGRALLLRYLRQFPEDGGMTAMRAAREVRDEAALWQAAHQLRGACRTLGLGDLAEAAERCMAAPEAAWAELERAYDRAVAVIGLLSDDDADAGAAPGMRAFHGLRALLAEDDSLCAQVSAELLAGLGLRVRVARSGDEAVRLAEQGGFDCAFLDAHMPGGDNVSTVRAVCRALPDAPVFALTAGLRPGEEERLRAAGLRACVHKPADATELARLLSMCFPEQ